jgi:hypothetical protein
MIMVRLDIIEVENVRTNVNAFTTVEKTMY